MRRRSCQRCALEASNALGGDFGRGGSSSSSSSALSEDGDDAEGWERGGDGYSVEYSLWMLKFLCPQEGCGGTLAPPHPTAEVMEVRHACRAWAHAGLMTSTRGTQCNYCGYERTDAEFYQHLSA